MIVRAFIVFAAIVAGGMMMIGWNDAGGDVVESDAVIGPLAANFDFEMPSGTRILFDDPTARGWTKTGIVPDTYERTVHFVSDRMTRAGFKPAHRVEASQECGRVLVEWRDFSGQKVLWMIWKVSDGETGFSCGKEKK